MDNETEKEAWKLIEQGDAHLASNHELWKIATPPLKEKSARSFRPGVFQSAFGLGHPRHCKKGDLSGFEMTDNDHDTSGPQLFYVDELMRSSIIRE